MSEVIELNHQAENTYEFDLEIDGLTTVEVRAWFVLVVKGMEIVFPCTQDKNHFTCVIPPMPFVEKTAYKGAVRLVADGHFFEPIDNLIVNVMGNLSFERSDVKHMTVKTTLDGESAKVKDSKKSDSKKKVNETTVKTDVKRVETPSEIAKRVTDQVSLDNKPFRKKGIPASLSETIKTKDTLIEEEVSDFVNAEQELRSAKLRDILSNFTVSPESTPTKARFVKKS